ncbi:MAG: TRC40/GET3/ArsA family transport-energizing ATPase, partial [Acidobacteria bacterium]|nr:TRC40/GET3/ArsA family transport-energizing ATPase [Acidobacteriota bacterium]
IDDLLASREYDEIVVDTAPVGHTLRFFEMPAHFSRFLDFLDVASSRDEWLAQRFGGGRGKSQPFLEKWRASVERVQRALSDQESRIVLVTTPETFALNESVRAAKALADLDLRVSGIAINRAVLRAGSCARCKRRAHDFRHAREFLRRQFPRVPVHVGEDEGVPIFGVENLHAFARSVFTNAKPALRVRSPLIADLEFRPVPWPDVPTPLSLTVGKGGVGKTTTSAGLAFHQRQAARIPVTVCSTDPAPSLDDVFQQAIGDDVVPVLGDRGLRAIEVDSVAEFSRWSEGVKRKLESALTSDVRGMHVDLSFDRQVITALLDVVPPGVDEIFAIFRIFDLLFGDLHPGREEALIIDMAPTGHALELLRMPQRMQLWTRLLLKSLAAHRTLPLAQDVAVEIASAGQRFRALEEKLEDDGQSRVWPVMLAEPLPDRETGRLLQQIAEIGLHAAPLVVNRVIFLEDARGCARCRRSHAWQMATIRSVRQRMNSQELYVIRDFGREIAGKRALKKFTSQIWQVG